MERILNVRRLCLRTGGLALVVGGMISNTYGADDTEVAFTWRANTEPDLAGYKLYVGAQPRVYSSIVDAGLATTYRLTGLLRGASYYFALTAYNTSGLESPFSNELMYRVPELPATNTPPTLGPLADVTLVEDGLYLVGLSGIGPGHSNEVQALAVSAVSSDPALIPAPSVSYASPNSTGSLAIQPRPNAFGTAMITVTVDDGQLENSTTQRSFTVIVQPINDPPYFNALTDIVMDQETMDYPVLIDGIHSGAFNEQDVLTFSATSSRTDLIQVPRVIYSSPDSVALVSLSTVPGAAGTATLTVTVSDGQSSFSRAFSATVPAVNAPPVISEIPDQWVPKNRASNPIHFTVNDAETEATQLQVSATTSNPLVLPISGLTLGGSESNRTIIIDPINGRTGLSVVTLTASDGLATASVSFRVTVDLSEPVGSPTVAPLE